MNELLLVVDMQNGFVRNGVEKIIPNITKLLKHFKSANKLIAFTKYINKPNSPYVRFIHWNKMMSDSIDTEIVSELHPWAVDVFCKHYYSPFTAQFKQYIDNNNITKIYICGVATDSCIFKSAVDSFEREIEPLVIHDACFSHAGQEIHNAGTLLISRNIGQEQIINTEKAIQMIDI